MSTFRILNKGGNSGHSRRVLRMSITPIPKGIGVSLPSYMKNIQINQGGVHE